MLVYWRLCYTVNSKLQEHPHIWINTGPICRLNAETLDLPLEIISNWFHIPSCLHHMGMGQYLYIPFLGVIHIHFNPAILRFTKGVLLVLTCFDPSPYPKYIPHVPSPDYSDSKSPKFFSHGDHLARSTSGSHLDDD